MSNVAEGPGGAICVDGSGSVTGSVFQVVNTSFRSNVGMTGGAITAMNVLRLKVDSGKEGISLQLHIHPWLQVDSSRFHQNSAAMAGGDISAKGLDEESNFGALLGEGIVSMND